MFACQRSLTREEDNVCMRGWTDVHYFLSKLSFLMKTLFTCLTWDGEFPDVLNTLIIVISSVGLLTSPLTRIEEISALIGNSVAIVTKSCRVLNLIAFWLGGGILLIMIKFYILYVLQNGMKRRHAAQLTHLHNTVLVFHSAGWCYLGKLFGFLCACSVVRLLVTDRGKSREEQKWRGFTRHNHLQHRIKPLLTARK